MERKYLIAFDKEKEKRSLSYTNRYRIIRELERNHFLYTYDYDDDYTDVLYLSADDYTILHTKVKKEARVLVLALCDDRDFMPVRKGSDVLTQDAADTYRKADVILIYNCVERKLLDDVNVKGEIHVLKDEKTAEGLKNPSIENIQPFCSYYQIPKGKHIFVSFGKISSKEDIGTIETIARLYPEMVFISFYSDAIDMIQEKTRERLRSHDNLRLYEELPSELYASMFESVDGFLILGRKNHYHQLLIDARNKNIPFLVYKLKEPSALLSGCNVYYVQDYSDIFRSIQKITTASKAQSMIEKP